MEATNSLIAILYLLFFATNISSVPIAQQDEPDVFRLPNNVIPSNYKLHIDLDKEVFTEKTVPVFGSVEIKFRTTETVSEIYFNAHPDYITNIIVNFQNQNLTENLECTNVTTQICKLVVDSEISAGSEEVLKLDFSVKLSTTDMFGLYRSSYVTDANETKYLVTTKFEPIYARRAFPCFDEPAFKATFDISVTYPSAPNLTALGNTPGTTGPDESGFTTVTFATTPAMSTYPVAFTISEFTASESESNAGGVPHTVWSRADTETTRELAVTDGPKILHELNIFTGIDYSDIMVKMDQVAIPDFASGAMENWGLVTYRETAILWDDNESSNRYKQRVATVIGHEFSHMWFGDLVTMNWWSEIFLNEGFATYFEYHITDRVHNDWELPKQFVLEELQPALQADALISSLALQSSCSTPAEIKAKFDTISYSKGGSIIRMVEHIIGTDNFQKGLQNYLNTSAYQTTTPETLWTSLGTVQIDNTEVELTTVMENWTKKAGFPLLTVQLTGTQVEISQERFLLDTDPNSSSWFVPISYTTSDEKKFDDTSPKAWLVPSDPKLKIHLKKNPKWIMLNIEETGYYRVNYDDNLWSNIKTALASDDFDRISAVNRAQIVDDVFNLLKINKKQLAEAFDIIAFLKNDDDYYPWYPAFKGFSYILQKVEPKSSVETDLFNFLLGLMDKLYQSVTVAKDLDQIYTLKRMLAYSWACKLNNENCINVATTEFQKYKNTFIKPDKNLRSTVYCYGLKYSEDAADWTFIWNEFRASKLATEQITLLTSLACTQNTGILHGLLTFSITDASGIRPQDAMSVFQAVYTSSSDGLSVAFDFLIEHYLQIQTKYASMNALETIITGIADRITTQQEVDKLTEFINKDDLSEQFKVVAQKALETAKANIKWIAEFKPQLEDYFNDDTTASTTVSTVYTTVRTSTTEATTTVSTTTESNGVTISLSMFSVIFLLYIFMFNQ